MFELIESCPEQREGVGWTGRVTSAAIHMFLISAAVAATTKVVADKVDIGVTEIATIWPPSQPQLPTAPASIPGTAPALPVVAPALIPSTIPDPGSVVPDLPGTAATLTSWADPGPVPLGNELMTGTPSVPLDVGVVDEPPELLTHPTLRYPDVLRQAGIEGRVMIEAVVDTLGRAEAGSLRVVSSAHPLFDPAALSVVLGSHYQPARVAGRAVRVRIRVPVSFQIQR